MTWEHGNSEIPIWELEDWKLNKLYEVHDAFKKCVPCFASATEICKEIEDFILELQQKSTLPQRKSGKPTRWWRLRNTGTASGNRTVGCLPCHTAGQPAPWGISSHGRNISGTSSIFAPQANLLRTRNDWNARRGNGRYLKTPAIIDEETY